jgi:hypothetical protein
MLGDDNTIIGWYLPLDGKTIWREFLNENVLWQKYCEYNELPSWEKIIIS